MLDDKDIAVAALGRIKTQPETWDQEQWRVASAECGTAMCFAGHFADLDGRVEWAYRVDALVADRDLVRIKQTGEVMHVASYVAQRLGDEGGVDVMFKPYNTLEDLEAGVEAFKNGEDIADAVEASWRRRGL